VTDDELTRSDAGTLGALLTARTVSSAEIVAALLTCVDRLDRPPDGLRSVLEVNPEATTEAHALDAERRAGQVRGPLHGVPVLLKDNVDTAAPLHTTAGSWALRGTRPAGDAPLVRRLRDAGVVVLGKANLSEWANYRSTGSTSGWSAVGGLTLNPWDRTRTTCGSSSGSAAAVAAGFAPLSIGTETDGSIVCPASMCGVVGVKPTVGVVPSAGVVPISHSQDSVGPMARTVRDAAVLLAVLAGMAPTAYLKAASWSRSPVPGSLRGVRIGRPRPLSTPEAGIAAAVEAVIEVLAAAGATVVDDVEVASLGRLDRADELTVLDHELKAGLAAYLATRPPGAPRTLADVLAYNREHADLELCHFDQDIFERAERTTGLQAPAYLAARQRCIEVSRAGGIDAVLAEHHLDALVLPSSGPAWPVDLVHGDDGPPSDTEQDDDPAGYLTLAALAGYPLVTVPCGLVDGMPAGVAFSGTAGSEAMLLRLAHAYEVSAFGPEGSVGALGLPSAIRTA
jgi:amidase